MVWHISQKQALLAMSIGARWFPRIDAKIQQRPLGTT